MCWEKKLWKNWDGSWYICQTCLFWLRKHVFLTNNRLRPNVSLMLANSLRSWPYIDTALDQTCFCWVVKVPRARNRYKWPTKKHSHVLYRVRQGLATFCFWHHVGACGRTHPAGGIEPMLAQCWSIVADGVPTLAQRYLWCDREVRKWRSIKYVTC